MNLSNLISLESIEIGDECFGSVKTFKIDGLNQLKSVKIGKNSFTQKKNGYRDDESKSFHILNCESLEFIQIGDFSFSDFAGDFELKNLPLLKSIIIGSYYQSNSYSYSYLSNSNSNRSYYYVSHSFYHNSFVIRGIDLILNC